MVCLSSATDNGSRISNQSQRSKISSIDDSEQSVIEGDDLHQIKYM